LKFQDLPQIAKLDPKLSTKILWLRKSRLPGGGITFPTCPFIHTTVTKLENAIFKEELSYRKQIARKLCTHTLRAFIGLITPWPWNLS